MRKLVRTLCLGAALGSAAIAGAAIKPDTAIRYRQSVYHMIIWNFAPLGDMVKGKTPWDNAEFTRRADRIDFLSRQLLEGFPPGSDKGARTEAKPEIWLNYADFEAKMNGFITQAQALSAVAKTGDAAKMKTQFIETAKACKACHDKYRAED